MASRIIATAWLIVALVLTYGVFQVYRIITPMLAAMEATH